MRYELLYVQMCKLALFSREKNNLNNLLTNKKKVLFDFWEDLFECFMSMQNDNEMLMYMWI